ncbi:MAG: hypothetical protein QM535_14570 [Limnohabitans sp.]|nr:hypothetical protein [Limnohabitans sp.]
MNTSPKLNFENTFNTAFAIYKKTYGVAGFAFFFILVSFTAMFMTGVDYFIGIKNFTQKIKTFKPEELSYQGMVIYGGCILLITILIAPFNAGFLKMMKDADEENPIRFGTIFQYVNSSYFGKIISSTILISILNFVVSNLLLTIINTTTSFGKIAPSLISLSLSILFFLTIPYVIFDNLTAVEAIKRSILNSYNNFFSILGLFVIALIFGYLGIFAFIIGIFFTFPFYYCVQYAIYKNINEN